MNGATSTILDQKINTRFVVRFTLAVQALQNISEARLGCLYSCDYRHLKAWRACELPPWIVAGWPGIVQYGQSRSTSSEVSLR